MVGCFDREITDTLFQTIAEFAKEQLTLAFSNRENFIKTAETLAISDYEEITSSDTPKSAPIPIQGPEILKNFVFNMPAFAHDLPQPIFTTSIVPLIVKLFDYPVQTFQSQFLQTLPIAIISSKDD